MKNRVYEYQQIHKNECADSSTLQQLIIKFYYLYIGQLCQILHAKITRLALFIEKYGLSNLYDYYGLWWGLKIWVAYWQYKRISNSIT